MRHTENKVREGGLGYCLHPVWPTCKVSVTAPFRLFRITLGNHFVMILSFTPALSNYFNWILPGAEKEVVVTEEDRLENERWREMAAVL